MDSSRGFGSNRCYPSCCALFRLGFPLAPPLSRGLTRNNDALAGSFYKRHAISPWWLLPQWPLTAGKDAGSGSLSSPSRGAFHLSLTVLVHYRSLRVFSLGGWSPLLPTNSPGFVVLRLLAAAAAGLPRRDSHPLRWRFPTPSGRPAPATCLPEPTTPERLTTPWFGLFPPRSPLRRESRLISSRRATEMFQFARCPPLCLSFQHRVARHHSGGVAPFGISGLSARMQLPLNVSPVSASFIGP